jgi:hypothetical protein
VAVNVRLIGSYLSDLASATASSTAAGYDAANAVVLDRSSLWVAGGTTSVTLTYNLGSAQSVSAIAIANHNASGWSTVTIRKSTDNFAANDVLVETLTGMVTGEDYFKTFAAASSQYWRLSIASATAAPQVGIFYLGTPTTLTYNPWIGQENDDVYNVEKTIAQSGAVVAEQWGRRLIRTAMRWDVVETAAYTQLRDFLRTEGGPLRPFWYVPRDDATSNAYGRCYIVRAEEGSFRAQEIFGGLWSMSLAIKEEV